MFVSFDKEFREVSEHINFHGTELDWIANAADIADGQKGRAESDNARMSKLLSIAGRQFAKSHRKAKCEAISSVGCHPQRFRMIYTGVPLSTCPDPATGFGTLPKLKTFPHHLLRLR